MAKTTITDLKSRFETGDEPTGEDFIALIDTLADANELAVEVAAREAAITGVQETIASLATATDVYTKAETDSRIQAVVGAAPEALNTLQEIAAQLAVDQSATAALVTAMGGKLDKSGGVMSGPLDFNGNTMKRYNDLVYAGGVTAGNKTIDLVNGNMQMFTLGGNHQFTMPAISAGASFSLWITGGAGFTPTFSGVGAWIGTTSKATVPTFATAAGNVNVLTFACDGTSWYGFLSGTGV